MRSSVVIVAGLIAVLPVVAHAEMLISVQEAALPSASGATTFRGISRGPKIEVVDLKEGATLKSPLNLKMTFKSFGGATVNADSVKVTYVKNPAVDLTPRVKKYIQVGGLDMPAAELPPGDHEFLVELRDSDGRPGVTTFKLKIQ